MAGTLMMFWDYDTQWGADRSRSAGGAKTWGALEFEYTDVLLDLHAQFAIPACFAVVGAAALPGERPYHDPVQIRRIHTLGHEVASHAMRHEWLPELSLTALHETLTASKDALEQCISAPVLSFVPPFNQPFDYPAKWSFSLSERRVGKHHVHLQRLCEVLGQVGYRFCRVAYRPLAQRALEIITRKGSNQPSDIEMIAGVRCVRINTPGGFAQASQDMLTTCAERGGTCVVYGHPHSLMTENSQHIRHLRTFLELASTLKKQGQLQVQLPTRSTPSIGAS